jgi:hypothetical protein
MRLPDYRSDGADAAALDEPSDAVGRRSGADGWLSGLPRTVRVSARWSAARAARSVVAHPPLAAFLMVYLLTCYVGAMALLFGPDALRRWYVANTGSSMPVLTGRTVLIDLVLLNAAPAVLCGGWWVGGFVRRVPLVRRIRAVVGARVVTPQEARRDPRILLVLGAALAVLSAALLAREMSAGSLHLLRGWLQYGSFVGGRAALTARLSEWDFVGAYTVLPLLVGLVLAELRTQRVGWRLALPVGLASLGVFLAINLLLLQKRPLLTGLAVIGVTIAARTATRPAGAARRESVRRWAIAAAAVIVVLFGIYAGLLLAPIEGTSAPAGVAQRTIVASEFALLGPVGYATVSPFLNQGATLKLDDSVPGGALQVTTYGSAQGTSYQVGTQPTGTRVELEVTLSRSAGAGGVTIFLGHSERDSASATVPVGAAPTSYRLQWIVDNANPVYIAVRAAGAARLSLSDVVLRRIARPTSLVLFPPAQITAQGFSTNGPSLKVGAVTHMVTSAGGTRDLLTVRARRSLQGIEYPIGPATKDSGLELTVVIAPARVRSPVHRGPRQTIIFGSAAGGYTSTNARAGRRPAFVTLLLFPRATAPAAVTVRAQHPGEFSILGITVRELTAARTSAHPRPVPATGGRLPLGVIRFPSTAQALKTASEGLTVLPFLAFATRTSGPAIAYPALYPGHHPYESVDLGLWVLGWSGAATDNISSYAMLHPGAATPGTNAVPFMFALYAQGGILVALLGAFIIGVVWRVGWMVIPNRRTRVGACMCALLVLFGIYIAQDAAINSLLTSYGVGWALGALGLFAIGAAGWRWSRSPSAPRGSERSGRGLLNIGGR